MTTKKVVTRTQRTRRRTQFEGFNFTREMVVPGDGSGILADFHARAWDAFEKLSYPTTKDEPWRRTDIRGLDSDFQLPALDAYLDLPAIPSRLLKPLVGDQHGGQITLLPGGMEKNFEPESVPKGVIFTDFETASRAYPKEFGKALGQIVDPAEGKFAALTAALAPNGVFVYVPRGVQVKEPLHSLVWAAGESLAHFSHLVIWLEEGAELTYVHEVASPNGAQAQTLHGGIVELYVGAGANLRFVELQSLGDAVWNFTHERARVEQDGNVDWIFGAIGTRLTKNFSDLDLAGKGANGRMSGFYFTDGQQLLDHDTQQNHFAPHTTSDLLFKGALKGESRSVWQGMIYVAPDAQQTDGYQANRNLILSNNARADSIPGLEILADDVRCTHGATVGKIDPDLVFYLRSRGIPNEQAERLVVEGFFDPIMQRIPFDGVRNRFQEAIQEKMDAQ
ncbi:MAG: Fe-S cluster assembly protein SufD [Anaerolineae bacterium]|nr:Fe-S cluster assembly protein SufD [Anaerolineae bacterium]MBL6964915.1 Fe-S cluster assembly protein SufD [Anaerolineales bacterium]